MSNPALNDKVFDKVRREEAQAGWAAPQGGAVGSMAPAGDIFTQPPMTDGPVSPYTSARGGLMTMGGSVTATGVLFALLLVTGVVGWNAVDVVRDADGVAIGYSAPWWVWVGPLGGIAIALVLMFKPKLARFLAPVYALAQGLFLGAISAVFEAQFQGIVLQAVVATASVFFVMLFLYATRLIRVTAGFRRAVLAATLGVLVMYLGSWIASLFGAEPTWITSSSWLSIGISVLVIGVAAFNLMLDFDFIEKGSAAGMPKYMEWFAAFGLMVTIVWLYLEILKLLAKLRER